MRSHKDSKMFSIPLNSMRGISELGICFSSEAKPVCFRSWWNVQAFPSLVWVFSTLRALGFRMGGFVDGLKRKKEYEDEPVLVERFILDSCEPVSSPI